LRVFKQIGVANIATSIPILIPLASCIVFHVLTRINKKDALKETPSSY
jgi:hypothetical protein